MSRRGKRRRTPEQKKMARKYKTARYVRLLRAGLCVRCAKPKTEDERKLALCMCASCRETVRLIERARYRAAHGIPADQPLSNRGPQPVDLVV